MRAFLYSGVHKRANTAFRAIATGKWFGFETDTVTGRDAVSAPWRARGRDYARLSYTPIPQPA